MIFKRSFESSSSFPIQVDLSKQNSQVLEQQQKQTINNQMCKQWLKMNRIEAKLPDWKIV